MNAKNLMLRAALAASVVGSLGFAGLSPASATLITLSGPGSDFGGGSPIPSPARRLRATQGDLSAPMAVPAW